MADFVDSRGQPLRVQSRADLARPYAVATVSGVRRVWETGSIAARLTPESLAAILQAADRGDARAYLTLAMEMERREAHYRSVLGTRKRAVTRLPVSVEAASDDAADVALADEIRALIRAPGFRSLRAHLLDGIGKGFAVCEMRWDTRRTPWVPRDRVDPKTGERIRGYEWIDPRWFVYDPDLGAPLRLLDDADTRLGIPLPPYRYIVHEPELMSGHPLGAGLARPATISYMAKSYTLKDWLAFAECYGMPLRVGKYGPGASDEDIATLVQAVANIGSDAAATMPESMAIEFVQAANAHSSEVFSTLAKWADDQVSKLVLGQTASAEGGAPGMGGQDAQTEVREDIRDADAEELSDTLDRDLVAAYLALNHGAMDREESPRIVIAAPDRADIPVLKDALAALVPLGLRVEASVVRDRLGLPDPPTDREVEVLGAPVPTAPQPAATVQPNRTLALNAAADPVPAPPAAWGDRLERDAAPALRGMLDQVKRMADRAGSLDELLAMIEAGFPDLDPGPLAQTLTLAAQAAALAGMAAVQDEIGPP